MVSLRERAPSLFVGVFEVAPGGGVGRPPLHAQLLVRPAGLSSRRVHSVLVMDVHEECICGVYAAVARRQLSRTVQLHQTYQTTRTNLSD